MSCYVIQCFMLCYITYVQNMLYNRTCYITCVMLCHIPYVMLYNICHVILYDMSCYVI